MATPESNPLDAAGPLVTSQPLAVAAGSAEIERLEQELADLDKRITPLQEAYESDTYPGDYWMLRNKLCGLYSIRQPKQRRLNQLRLSSPNNPVSNAAKVAEQQNGPSNGVAL